MKKITKDWFQSALSDIEVIEHLIDNPNLTHQASYHAQQAIEKSFKAILEEFDMGFVKTHSLEFLYEKVKDALEISIDTDQIILLDQLYIDARYPGMLGFMPEGMPSVHEARSFYELALSLMNACREACK